MRKWVVPLLVGVALGPMALGMATTSALAVSAPAGADTPVDCSSGVIVAADFATWGGGINTVCDPQLPDNAADALVATNFHPGGVSSYPGLSFICTIGGYPGNDPCTSTPPGNAYWSLWYANAGADVWTYSQVGAENLHPQAGSVEAWVYGGNAGATPPASFPSPNTLRADTTDVVTPTTAPSPPPTNTSPPPTLTTTTGAPPSGSPTGGSSGGSPGGGPGATAGRPAPHPASTTNPTAGTGTPTATKTGSAPTGGTVAPLSSQLPSTATGAGAARPSSPSIPKIIDAAPTVAGLQPAQSPVPFVVGAAIVALLAGGGGFIAWRRHRTG